MDSRTQFLLQLLQKLGAPLMKAVNSQPSNDESGQKDAGTMASLLTESVKISIALSQAMNLKADDGNADAIRVSLATLAADLVADSYRQTGRLPTDNDGRRISKSLEAVLAFSDNFAPAAEHAQRLATLDGTPPFFDAVQSNLYAINALAPAIGAIVEFSFGESETRLIQTVSERLHDRARELKEGFAVPGDAASSAMSEMVILQALGQMYASAHRAETVRLKAMSEEARGSSSLDPVWQSFDRQVAMVEILLKSMVGAPVTASRGGGGGVKPDIAPPVSEAPPVQAAPPAAAPPAGNPMAFFKKK